MEHSILASSLNKKFRDFHAVRNLDLEVGVGQTFGFLGPNGAGKSTTIRMLLGLVRPTSGAASVLGHDIQYERMSALKKVGAMVETPAFYMFLTARENVKLFGRLSGSVTEKSVDHVLDQVGLLARASSKVRTFSHGMKQRLGIACALVSRPELIILDEPTNGLDPEGVKEVRELVKSLAGDHGMTVFLSSHLLFEVEQTCTHVAIISHGRSLAHGPVRDLLGSGYGPVEFEVDNVEAATHVLRTDFGAEIIWEDDTRVSANLDHEAVPDCNQKLVGLGIRVRAIERKQRSLEDFYLELMREGAMAEADYQ